MMLIIKLQIKLLLNLVGQPEHDLHQSGTVILSWKSCYWTKANLRTMMSLDSDRWLVAMKSEIESMYENKVWTLVDLPDDRQAIENKWIFKKKTDADGNVTVYKARLV